MTGPRGTRLLRLFPKAWREVYGAEFLALIEDCPPGPRDAIDILVSAVDARLRPSAWIAASRQEMQRERGLVLQAASGPAPVPEPGTRIRVGGVAAGHSTPVADRRFSRRTFLRNALVGSVVVAAGGSGAAIFAYSSPEPTSTFGSRIVVPISEVPAVGADPVKYADGRFWLIHNDDGVLALHWRCTHLGCTVPWEPADATGPKFRCPCHRSGFNRLGERVEGPAPRPLDVMNAWVTTEGDLVVDTGNIIVRETYEPSQAVRL